LRRWFSFLSFSIPKMEGLLSHSGPSQPKSRAGALRDIVAEARLTASSSKAGHGVSSVAAPGDDFWQSDALLPHWLHARWPRPRALAAVELALNHGRDESYTPARVVVLAGDDGGHMVEVAAVDVPDDGGEARADAPLVVDLIEANDGTPVVSRDLRLLITSNCANGKDSRVRRLRIIAT
jgi:hypothetical protein